MISHCFGTMVRVHKIPMIFHVILQAFTLAIDLKRQGSAAHLKFVEVQRNHKFLGTDCQHFIHAKCIAAHIVLDLVHIFLEAHRLDFRQVEVLVLLDPLWSSGLRKVLELNCSWGREQPPASFQLSQESLKTVLVTMNRRNLLWLKAWGVPCPLKVKIVLEEDQECDKARTLCKATTNAAVGPCDSPPRKGIPPGQGTLLRMRLLGISPSSTAKKWMAGMVALYLSSWKLAWTNTMNNIYGCWLILLKIHVEYCCGFMWFLLCVEYDSWIFLVDLMLWHIIP